MKYFSFWWGGEWQGILVVLIIQSRLSGHIYVNQVSQLTLQCDYYKPGT